MDFVNITDLNADFFNTVMGEDRLLGAVIVRPTFRIEGSALVHTPDDPWPIDMGPMITPYGEFPGDMPFLSGGVDVFVVGNAYQPDGYARPWIQVDIEVGQGFRHSIVVIGNRAWVKGQGGLVPSEPEPFVSMPLTYENAFGGKVMLDEGEFSYPTNPYGKGYYTTQENAEGQPLPNLENPASLITQFTDQPEPVGTAPYPKDGGLRPLNAVDMRADNSGLERIKPTFFNAAHPRMIIPPAASPRAGETVSVTNVLPHGNLEFELPGLSTHVHVQLEGRSYVCPLHLDQIGIIAEESKVFLSYRVVFKYRMVEYERRVTTLHHGLAPATVPPEYVSVWED